MIIALASDGRIFDFNPELIIVGAIVVRSIDAVAGSFISSLIIDKDNKVEFERMNLSLNSNSGPI